MSTNWYSMKWIISEEDFNGLLQFHTGTAFLQMMVMAAFGEKENLHPRHDQICYQFLILSCAQNILCILVISKYPMFNSNCEFLFSVKTDILIILNAFSFAQC